MCNVSLVTTFEGNHLITHVHKKIVVQSSIHRASHLATCEHQYIFLFLEDRGKLSTKNIQLGADSAASPWETSTLCPPRAQSPARARLGWAPERWCPGSPAQPMRVQHGFSWTNHSSPAPARSSPAPSASACRRPARGGCSAAPPPANQSEVRTVVTWPALHQCQLTWRLHCRSLMAFRLPFQCRSWNTVITWTEKVISIGLSRQRHFEALTAQILLQCSNPRLCEN